LLAGFSGESLRKPVFENLAASGLAGLTGMADCLFKRAIEIMNEEVVEGERDTSRK
jgi:hypothetical protein